MGARLDLLDRARRRLGAVLLTDDPSASPCANRCLIS
jgi:hypothetical protein